MRAGIQIARFDRRFGGSLRTRRFRDISGGAPREVPPYAVATSENPVAKAAAGKESNWVPTDPARKFELMFRLYAPTKALFDKTWKLPDIEEAK